MPTPPPSARPGTDRAQTDARAALAAARLYLCTDACGFGREHTELGPFRRLVRAAYAGGVDIVQLRDKGGGAGLEAGPELAALEVLAQEADRAGALFAVNDRADVATLAGAPVLHVGQDDLTPQQARRVAPGALVGLSTHDEIQLASAVAAAAAGSLDYLCVGPVWSTPTKPGRPAAGIDLLHAAARTAVRVPWFAIGGIGEANLEEVLAAGATRIVIVRAITASDDPEAAARRLRGRLPG